MAASIENLNFVAAMGVMVAFMLFACAAVKQNNEKYQKRNNGRPCRRLVGIVRVCTLLVDNGDDNSGCCAKFARHLSTALCAHQRPVLPSSAASKAAANLLRGAEGSQQAGGVSWPLCEAARLNMAHRMAAWRRRAQPARRVEASCRQ